MIRVQRGRGGWVKSDRWLNHAIAAAAVIVAVTIAGCSSKQPQQGAGANGTSAGSTIGEGGVGSGGGSSLTDFQKGTTSQGPLSDIHFGFNDYTISPQDGQVLQSNAKWLQAHPNSRVQIEGHCDERGSEEYNIALGARRAQAAKDYLVTLGIPADRISTISYGKELPLCTEHDEECWAQNRRDHFVVTGS
jgi:peptidoglycan-associated lipoprotein